MSTSTKKKLSAKSLTLTLAILLPVVMFAQNAAWQGCGMRPNGKYHYMNIFVNIIYDVNPEKNAAFTNNDFWPTVTNPEDDGVNNCAIPTYLLDWMDIKYDSEHLHGTLTRLYGESSFDSLQITGDFFIVNLKESTILQNGAFDKNNIRNIAKKMISEGRYKSLYQHLTLEDFTKINNGTLYSNTLIRNITLEYGGLNPGGGFGGKNTLQCVGDGPFAYNPTNIVTHEVSHSIFGGNNFHTSGGNHRNTGATMPFLNIQGGFGLMGAAHSSLVSCNGYERWRVHWKHHSAADYISARNTNNTASVPSDVSIEDGNVTFVLRDFVTYGDAIRIKLPYKDSELSPNQYIWLENHKVGLNEKLDYLQYSELNDCRPQGSAGVYAYYQIGRDTLEGSNRQIWDYFNCDNLKIIPAEGYFDYELIPDTYNLQCVSYDEHYYTMVRGRENPFCGGQDQEMHLFPAENATTLSVFDELTMWRKKTGETNYDNLPLLGDQFDAFSTRTEINMATNPSTCNAKVYYSANEITKSDSKIISKESHKNVQTTYLTGLGIEIIPISETGDMIVRITWNDYKIKNDAVWTGKIALKDSAIITSGNTITLAQNRTVAQATRDSETGLFAGKTQWKCENGSYLQIDSASVLRLTENSSLTFENGSTLALNKDSRMEIHSGCTVTLEPTVNSLINGYIEVDSGGILIVNDTAKFGTDARLNVKPGGKILYGGKLHFFRNGSSKTKRH